MKPNKVKNKHDSYNKLFLSGELSPRDNIYSLIVKNPGLHFREIQRRTGYATGAIQYHVDYLLKKNYVNGKKEGKFTRYYAKESQANPEIMNLLRQEQVRNILMALINNKKLSINELSKGLNLTTTTTKFHLKKLLDSNIIKENKTKNETTYSLIEKEPILEHLIVYKKSFLDTLVNRFVELWEKELSLEFEE